MTGSKVRSLPLAALVTGELISTFGVDAGTYVASFLIVKVLVPHRRRVSAPGESGGLLDGLRFLVRDRLLGPMIASVIVANMAGPALSVGLLALAYRDYGQSSRVAGVLVAATSAGAILGVIAAMRLLTRVAPFTLATVAFVGGVLPLWALTVKAPVAVLVVALAVFGASTPLINAPVLGALTMRTPEALRAKVMAAVITVATLAGPLGATAAGPLIGAIGTRAVLGLVAGAMTLSALAFAAVVIARQHDLTAAPSVEGV